MKEYLADLIKNVSALDFDVIKVTGTKEGTKITTRTQDTSMILYGTFKKPLAEFEGVFGVNNIPMLNGLVSLSAFKDKKATIKVGRMEKDGMSVPTEIIFESPGVAKASHRLVGEKQIPKQLQANVEINWDVVIKNPNKQRINDFAQLSSIYAAQETRFGVRTEKGELKFIIGNEDSSTHKAAFTFAEEVTGNLKAGYMWNTVAVLNVLKLAAGAESSVLRISNQGAMRIDISTEFADYEFIFSAFS